VRKSEAEGVGARSCLLLMGRLVRDGSALCGLLVAPLIWSSQEEQAGTWQQEVTLLTEVYG